VNKRKLSYGIVVRLMRVFHKLNIYSHYFVHEFDAEKANSYYVRYEGLRWE